MKAIIKGTPAQAIDAAQERNIPVLKFYRSNATRDEVILVIDEAYWNEVARWFNEQPWNAPFPIGTCLFYSSEKLKEA